MAEITATLTCPKAGANPLKGCGSTNVSQPDDEGLCDCLDCGIFFSKWEAMGLVEVRVFLPDGKDTIVYVKPDSPMLEAPSWSAHPDKQK